MPTTIQLEKNLKKRLTDLKMFSNETYNDVIKRLVNIAVQENVEELSSETLANIQQSLEDIKAGRVHDHEDVRKMLNL
jgi:predicted transcriptional regulator